MENNINIDEKTRNEIIYNFIKNLNDIKMKSLNINIDKYTNHINKDLLKEKDKKIENLQKQCEELKKQLEKKNESEKNNNDDIKINTYKNNMYNDYNTSTNFPVKHEIKKIWEEFALVSILDTFIDYESEPEKIFHLISEMILLMDKLINNLCLELYEKVSLSLNIPIKDKKFIYDIEKISRPLIKEHLNTIFIDTENRPFIDNFIYLFKNSLKSNNLLMSNKKDKDTIEQIINDEEFTQITKIIKDILLYTKFNDQKLFFKIEPDIKKRNVEKVILNSLNDKKKYLIINDNNLINCQAIVILNPPVMKNGFPLNNDFKTIIMILDENNYVNNNSIIEKNLMNHTYEICANSFSIYDNNLIENSEDKRNIEIKNYNNNMNNIGVYKDNILSIPATRNNENKNKIKLRLEFKTSLPSINKVIDNESEKSKRTYREQNINYFNNNIIQNKKSSINCSINNNIKNINSTFVKEHKPFIGNIYLKSGLNKNSFCNFNPKVQELLYDSLLQSEYANSPKNLSHDSLIPEQDILISINNDKIKNFDNSDLIRNYNNFNYELNMNNKKRSSLINRNNNKRKSSTNSKRNLYIMNKKKFEKKMSNHSDKNINKKISNNEIIKYGRHHHIFKDVCSTEINHNSHNSYNFNDDSGCLKKNRTVKEMNKIKTNLKDEKYIFPINYDHNQYISENKLLYQNFGKKNISKRNDMNLLKEHLDNKKKKLKYNNKISNNYNSNSNKCEKNNSFKHKMNKLNNNIDYKNDHFNIQRIFHYSPANTNMTFTSSKNNYNNIVKNRINKNMVKKEDNNNYNNSNIRNNNSSYNSNNANINKTQSQTSSTIMKNSTINTGFKIKNVNINYFNIMQPSDLFFNQQRTNRSKSRQNDSKQNSSNISYQNNLKNYQKNNNLKANNYSNTLLNFNSNDNSLKTEKIKKEKKVRLTKLSETRKHNESCLSNDIKRPKIRINEYKKLKRLKQLGNEMNRNNNSKKFNIGNNFSLTNNKQVSFIRIPSKISNTSSKKKSDNKNMNNKQKKIERRNNHVVNNSCTNKKINNDNYYFNSQNKIGINYNYDNQSILSQNKNSNKDIIINRNNQNSPYFPKKQKSFAQKNY